MVFSSAIFLFYFFPVFILLYWLAPIRFKNWTALFGSFIFYVWGAPMFIYVLLASIFLDFFLGNLIFQTSTQKRKKYLLFCSILLNVGLLAYFKYANFFVENINEGLNVLGLEAMNWTKVVLPIGISFFTFQKLSYIIDIYYKKAQPLKQVSAYALYILLFPQLIAGPIVRFNEIAAQIKDRRNNFTVENKLNGLFRFTIGLSKKMLIANPLGEQVDLAFAGDLSTLGIANAWVIILAYAFQIYFDFSGYSDMAIGIGRMLGFRFPENFNFPYLSRSITEFWRRWHITLSNWMRDYLYIPLGGNRVSTGRLYINLWIVFLLSGLWHGAAWNFVLWGAFHGFFLILDRLFLLRFFDKIGHLSSLLLTFFITLLGWVLFRVESLEMASQFFQQLFFGQIIPVLFSKHFWSVFCLATCICFLPFSKKWETALSKVYTNEAYTGLITKSFATLLLLFLCMTEIQVSGFNPFIYFRF